MEILTKHKKNTEEKERTNSLGHLDLLSWARVQSGEEFPDRSSSTCEGQGGGEDQADPVTYGGWGREHEYQGTISSPGSLPPLCCIVPTPEAGDEEDRVMVKIKIKIRACKLAAYEPNFACRWVLFGRHSMIKINVSWHLMITSLDFKKKVCIFGYS